MTHPLRDPAQHHEDAIHQLVEHLFRCCFDRFDDDMDKAVQGVIESFRRYRAHGPAYQYPEDLLDDDALSRNFMVAQQAILLLFANQITILSQQPAGALLKDPIQQLWQSMRGKLCSFFRGAATGSS